MFEILTWAFMALPFVIAAFWLTFVVRTFKRIRPRWLWAVVSVLSVPLAVFVWMGIILGFWYGACSAHPGESC